MSSYDPRPRSFRWVQKAHVLRYAEAKAVSEKLGEINTDCEKKGFFNLANIQSTLRDW